MSLQNIANVCDVVPKVTRSFDVMMSRRHGTAVSNFGRSCWKVHVECKRVLYV